MQKRYVGADRTSALLAEYHGQFQSNVLGLVGKVDPAGQWPALDPVYTAALWPRWGTSTTRVPKLRAMPC